MKILTFGFYDDFARFFLAFEQHEKVEVCHISQHLSGYLYCKSNNFKNSKSLLLDFWKLKFSKKNNSIKKYDDKIFDYHSIRNNYKKNIKRFNIAASSYEYLFSCYISEYKPDIVLISGDTRLSSILLKDLCEQLNLKHYFFEQGPFGTTIIDPLGVNAFASVKNNWQSFPDTQNSSCAQLIKFIEREKQTPFKRNPLFRLNDLIFSSWPFYFILPIDMKERGIGARLSSWLKTKRSQKRRKKYIRNRSRKTCLLALQVPEDANMIIHSPYFKDHKSILEACVRSLPAEWDLLVREHPLYRGGYEEELYQLVNEYSSQVFLDLNQKSIESVKQADAIIVNNSMLGVESLLTLKPILALGNSYYQDAVNLARSSDDIKNFLENLPDIKKSTRVKFMSKLCLDYLFRGHFRDENINALTQDILEYIKKS